MRRAPFALLAFVIASAFAKSPAPEVIFISPCECRGASLVVATSLFVGWADEPPPPPREFLEGRVQAISRQDQREIIALAKKELIRTGRASHPIYCIYVESSDLVYVYHGEERKRVGDVEEALIVERVHGRWQLGERQIVRGATYLD